MGKKKEDSDLKLTDAEKETLIEEIGDHDIIWNANMEGHKVKKEVNQAYDEIAHFMSKTGRVFTGDFMKNEWTKLRNAFNNNKRNAKPSSGDGGEDHGIKWKYYDLIDKFMSTIKKFDGKEDRITNAVPTKSSPNKISANDTQEGAFTQTSETTFTQDQNSQASPNSISAFPSLIRAQMHFDESKMPVAPRKNSKRKKCSGDDEVENALIQALMNSDKATPLGQMVSDLERKLEEKGLYVQLRDFKRTITSAIYDSEETLL